MIHYRLKTPAGDVDVLLRATKKDEVAPLVISGDDRAVLMVKRSLEHALDDRGRVLGDRTTPHHLKWAMRDRTAQMHQPVLVEDDVVW